jgi:putative ABC transport system permease protein
MIKGISQDLRFAWRILRKTPGFTIAAVISLALGIGANTAIFQLLDAVRLKALPVRAPHELARIDLVDPGNRRGSYSEQYNAVTYPIWEQIRDHQQAFAGIFAWSPGNFNLAQGGEVRNAKVLWVSGEFFNVLGVPPLKGRVLNSQDDVRGCGSPGVVISHSFWQKEFGGAPDVLGRKLPLADHALEVVGVTPPDFFGLEVGKSFDFALPLCAQGVLRGKSSWLDSGTMWWLMITGRLKSGESMAQASSSLQAMSPALFQSSLPPNYPEVSVRDYLNSKLQARPVTAGYSLLREEYERPLWFLLGIAGLVLLIACANLANLLLARGSMREREMAVRQAVGASRGRVIRQLLAESLLLAAIGAALGAGLAQALSRFLVDFISTTGNSIVLDLSIDWRLIAFATGIAATTCILFGLTPALRATRVSAAAAMRANGRGLTAGRERFSLRRALVVAQVALSLVLVTGALLFTRSLGKLVMVDPGFTQSGIVIAHAGFGSLNLGPEQRAAYRAQLLDRLRAIPGVEAVADTSLVPISGQSLGNNVWIEENPELRITSGFSWVSPSFFATLRTPVLAGRDFDASDTKTSARVAIVNQTFAREVFHGRNPIGQRYWVEKTPWEPERSYEIVGLVRDTKYENVREDFGPIAFMPVAQETDPNPAGQFLIRSNLPEGQITNSVKQVLLDVNPGITLRFQNFKTMIDESLLRDRLMATLSGFFGLLALILASIGLYGLLSYGVASRRNEIGIRMALGAPVGAVLSMIMREGVILICVGIAVGLPFVLGLTRLARSMLFDLSPTDPFSLTAAALFLFAVAMVAGFIPARRASKVDPLVALRDE